MVTLIPLPSCARVPAAGETDASAVLLACDSAAEFPAALRQYQGRVQCVYIDPPFMSGGKYSRKRPVGESGWKTGSPCQEFPSYSDVLSPAEYYAMLLAILQNAWRLLSPTGVVYLHLDWHGDYIGRLALNQVFGEGSFVDEIIWAYQTGGRSKQYFSHKHDTILMAKKGKTFPFDISKVPLENSRQGAKRNHMRVEVDSQGNAWRTIRSSGKIYRYDALAPEYPTDVWCDISHLQQRDPERTGFLTQKPSRLLDRLLLPVLSPGDIFCDLTCGSGSSLHSALKIGCTAIGCDISHGALSVAEHRLSGYPVTYLVPADTAALPMGPTASLACRLAPDSIQLLAFDDGSSVYQSLDGIETWRTGALSGGVFRVSAQCRRSRKCPQLLSAAPVRPGDNAIDISSPAGQRFVFRFK